MSFFKRLLRIFIPSFISLIGIASLCTSAYTHAYVVINSASFSPNPVAPGGSSTLTWTGAAEGCSIGDGQSYPYGSGSKTYTNVTATMDVTIVCGAYRVTPVELTVTLTVLPKPGTPSSITVPSTDSDGTFTVNWGSASGTVSRYEVVRRVSGASWPNESNTPNVYSGSNRSKTDSPSSDGIYQYRVKACNSSGCSAWRTSSNVTVLNPPGTPGGFTLPSSDTDGLSILVSWGAASGSVSEYKLQREKNGNGSWSGVYTGSARSRNDSPNNDGTYKYRVQACNGSGCSDWRTSNTVTVLNPPGTPGAFTLPSSDTDGLSILVSWGTASGSVSQYKLQREKNGNGSWSGVYTGSARSRNDSPNNDGTYKYRVQACNGSGCSGWRNSGNVVVLNVPGIPSSIGGPSQDNDGSYTVSWGQAPGAETSYNFQRKVGSGSWSSNIVRTVRNYTESNLTNNSYYYRVQACNASGCGGWKTSSATVVDLAAPGIPASINLPSVDADGTFTVTWGAATGNLSNYELQRLNSSGAPTGLGSFSSSTTSYSQSTLSEGTYTYRVRGCFNGVCSPWKTSGQILVQRTPNNPVNFTAPQTNHDGNISLSWSTPAGIVTEYQLHRKVVGETVWTDIGTTSSTHYLHNGVGYGEYVYRVRACNGGYCSSGAESSTVSVAAPPLASSVGSTGFDFSTASLPSSLMSLGESDFVARTQGNLSVSMGSADFSVPLVLPPAINNLKPKLSLTYSSSDGDSGLVGVGWGIAGLSSIYRCSPNFATDGASMQKSTPRYTDEDRLCMDGERLLLEGSGAYWSGSTYVTEEASFSKIERHEIGTGYFKVFATNGLIYYYGEEADGQNSVEFATGRAGEMVSSWNLDKVEDRYGNAYTLHYESNNANGEHFIKHINLTPSSSVVFNYVDRETQTNSNGIRPDIPWGFDKGHKYKVTKLLDSVTTYIDNSSSPTSGTPVREYDIEYARSADTHRYLVDNIKECGFDAFSARQCATPLTFEWQQGELGFETTPEQVFYCDGSAMSFGETGQFQDIDGDGYVDYLRGGSRAGVTDYLLMAWGTPEGCFTKETFDYTNTGPVWNFVVNTKTGPAVLNYYGGRGWQNSTPSQDAVLKKLEWTKSSTEGTETHLLQKVHNSVPGRTISDLMPWIVVGPGVDFGYGPIVRQVDLNRDGLTDLVLDGHIYIQNNTETLSFDYQGDRFDLEWDEAEGEFIDFDQDGLVDYGRYFSNESGPASKRTNFILTKNPGWHSGAPFENSGPFELRSSGCNVVVHPDSAGMAKFKIGDKNYFPDLNGDGAPDHVAWGLANETDGSVFWEVTFGDGNGFSQSNHHVTNLPKPSNLACEQSFVYDYNKDGLQDIILLDNAPEGSFMYEGFLRDAWVYKVMLAYLENDQVKFELTDIEPFNGIMSDYYFFNAFSTTPHFIGDFNNDGVEDLHYGSQFYKGKTKRPDVLVKIVDGFGVEARINYSEMSGKLINGRPFYTPASLPLEKSVVQGARSDSLVSSVSRSNGNGGFNDTYYYYSGAKEHTQGRGFLGFEKIETVSQQKGIVKTTEFNTAYPHQGTVKSELVASANGDLISHSEAQYTTHSGNPRFHYLKKSVSKQYGLTTQNIHLPVSVSEVKYVYDEYGGQEYRVTTQGSDYTAGDDGPAEESTCSTGRFAGYSQCERVSNTLVNDTTTWLLGKVTSSVRTHSDSSGDTHSVTTNNVYAYANTNGGAPGSGEPTYDIYEATVFPGTPQEAVTTIKRNARGITYETMTDAKDYDQTTAPTRSQSLSNFDVEMFPRSITNAMGHVTHMEYDKRFGEVSQTTKVDNNLNSLIHTTAEFDSLGRSVKATDAFGNVVETLRYFCSAAAVCPQNAHYYVVQESSHISASVDTRVAPRSIRYFDALSRVVRSESYSFTGDVVKVDIEYDQFGRQFRKSLPYTGATPNHWSTTSFNILDKPTNIVEADGGGVDYTYTAMTLAVSGDRGVKIEKAIRVIHPVTGQTTQTTEVHLNALEQTVQVLDDHGVPIDYTYDAKGRLKRTRVNNNTSTDITITYDIAGNKKTLTDPDTGHITYEYNGFGEMRRQTWLKGTGNEKSITYSYDKLGRKTQRVDDTPTLDSTFSWVWDGNNKPGTLSSKSGNGFSEAYTYSNKLQLLTQTTSITGLGARQFSYTYDGNHGRVETETTPSGFTTEVEYHANGEAVRTYSVSDTGLAEVLWRLGDTLDEMGNNPYQQMGNGVVTQRTVNPLSGRIQRIVSGNVTSQLYGNIQNLEYEVDSLGNFVTRKSMRTNLTGQEQEYLEEEAVYDSLNRLLYIETSDSIAIHTKMSATYDALGNIMTKRALDGLGNSITESDVGSYTYDSARVHAVRNAGGTAYNYDVYGNMTSRGGESLAYDAFNKPIQIGGTTFSYGPDHKRYKKVNGNKVTYYIAGGRYEEVVEGASSQQKSYVGKYLVHTKTGSETKLSYLHLDHLGSTETITDEFGKIDQRLSFDAWGKRRKDDWTPGEPPEPEIKGFTFTRGFTGHEHLANNLVHMNGRVYDSKIGRFLSTDIIVQFPQISQSYNRYSYTLNNPLSHTDPSGYDIFYYLMMRYSGGGGWEKPLFKNTVLTGEKKKAARKRRIRYKKILKKINEMKAKNDIVIIHAGGASGYVKGGDSAFAANIRAGGGKSTELAKNALVSDMFSPKSPFTGPYRQSYGVGQKGVNPVPPYRSATYSGGPGGPSYVDPDSIEANSSEWSSPGVGETSLWGAFKALTVARGAQALGVGGAASSVTGTAVAGATTENLTLQVQTTTYTGNVSDWHGTVYYGLMGGVKAIDFHGLSNTRSAVLQVTQSYRVMSGSSVLYTSAPQTMSISTVSDFTSNGYPAHDVVY